MITTIKIKFGDIDSNSTPIKDEDVVWRIMEGPPNYAVIRVQGTTRTNKVSGFIEIPNVNMGENETLKFQYDIVGTQGTLDLKHTWTSKKTKVFEKVLNVKIIDLAPVVIAPLTNPNRLWLTYESLFNKKEFKKPACEFKLHLYLIPVNDVTVWLRDDVKANHLQTFVNAFFPDFDTDYVKYLGRKFWSWKTQDRVDDVKAEFLDVVSKASKLASELTSDPYNLFNKFVNMVSTPSRTVGNRDKVVLHLESYVVLPYNRFDNSEESNAIATKNPDNNLLRIKDEDPYLWGAWKTASRSCVVRLPAAPVKDKGVLWKTGGTDSIARAYEAWQFDVSHRDPTFETLRNNPYDLAAKVENTDFSLKTGVEYVGTNFQGGANHKDIIGDWLIGCLRSDYITQVNKNLKPPPENLLVLTELITITEKKTRSLASIDGTMKYIEGIQVRDISLLKNDKIYLAPLNVPFLGTDLKEYKSEYQYLDAATPPDERQKWQKFWKYAFAALLGRAKALFMLRYGLQILNPNQQNFLIEFNADGTPTGTIAIRDLNDASVHREVVWALFDGAGLPPQEKDGWKKLATLEVPTFKYEFEEGRMAREGFGHQDMQETGTTGAKFGPPGTQFLWQRFSSFGNISKPAKGAAETNLTIFKNLLETMSVWGKAHNKAFISCVESHLGLNFTKIDWSKYPDPERHRQLDAIQGAQERLRPKRLDKSPAHGGFEIVGVAVAKLSDQQKIDLAGKIDVSDSKNEFLNEECLLISGTGFADTARIKIKNAEVSQIYVIGKADLLVVSPKVAGLKDAGGPDKKIEVVNPGDITAHYENKFDPDFLDEMGWEEKMAKFIHDYLAGAEGQKAVRDCRDRGWKTVKPIFRIQILDKDSKPIAEAPVRISRRNTEVWTDITDSNGEIHIYQGSPDEYKIRILGYDGPISNPERSVLELSQRESRKLDFNFVKVLYLS